MGVRAFQNAIPSPEALSLDRNKPTSRLQKPHSCFGDALKSLCIACPWRILVDLRGSPAIPESPQKHCKRRKSRATARTARPATATRTTTTATHRLQRTATTAGQHTHHSSTATDCNDVVSTGCNDGWSARAKMATERTVACSKSGRREESVIDLRKQHMGGSFLCFYWSFFELCRSGNRSGWVVPGPWGPIPGPKTL